MLKIIIAETHNLDQNCYHLNCVIAARSISLRDGYNGVGYLKSSAAFLKLYLNKKHHFRLGIQEDYQHKFC